MACDVQMTAIMLNFEEAKRNLALPMHGLLINGGMSLVSSMRLHFLASHSTSPVNPQSVSFALFCRLMEDISGIHCKANLPIHLTRLLMLRPLLTGLTSPKASRQGEPALLGKFAADELECSSKPDMCRVPAI